MALTYPTHPGLAHPLIQAPHVAEGGQPYGHGSKVDLEHKLHLQTTQSRVPKVDLDVLDDIIMPLMCGRAVVWEIVRGDESSILKGTYSDDRERTDWHVEANYITTTSTPFTPPTAPPYGTPPRFLLLS